MTQRKCIYLMVGDDGQSPQEKRLIPRSPPSTANRFLTSLARKHLTVKANKRLIRSRRIRTSENGTRCTTSLLSLRWSQGLIAFRCEMRAGSLFQLDGIKDAATIT